MKAKKNLGLAIASIAFFMTFNVNAQLQEKQSLINFGIGLGSSYSSSGFTTSIPPIEASYEMMISENLSVGGFFGVSSFGFEYKRSGYSTEINYNYYNFGGLVNYHFVNNETWNVYAGGRLGYTSSSIEYESKEIQEFLEETNSITGISGSGFLFAANAGVRYHLSEKFALNSELGFGISIFKIGITYKL
jgi:Outer membrane protein beta-barrel domain